jgi:hypothetical protein
MSFSPWLRNWKDSLERRSALKQIRRRRQPAGRIARRLLLEALEDRTLLSPVVIATNLTVSGSNGAVVSNSGTFTDTTAGASVALTASAGTVVQNSNGTWNWSESTPSGAAQTAPVTIYATDSNGQTGATDFWLNVGQLFTVTTGADNGDDSNPAPGSLRAAIVASNRVTGVYPNLIAFDIPNTDPSYDPSTGSFDVLTPAPGLTTIPNLPDLTSPVVIDGYSQPGSRSNTLAQGDNAVLEIVLNGRQVVSDGTQQYAWTGGMAGLNLLGGNTTVRGLVLNNFVGQGILISTSDNVVEGDYIGTDVTGTKAEGNDTSGTGTQGILVFGSVYAGFGGGDNGATGFDNQIGMYGNGTDDFADRNIISATGAFGGRSYGVELAGVSNNIIAGNYIGTDASGTQPLGNDGFGVAVTDILYGTGVNAPATGYNQIGGNSPSDVSDGNVISANINAGVAIAYDETDNTVYGNDIGTDVTGTQNLGNGQNGVNVGGLETGLAIGGNVIAYNGGYGVAVAQATTSAGVNLDNPTADGPVLGVRVEGNSIHDNKALGIDLGGTYDIDALSLVTPLPGVLLNDSQGHSGPNNFQDFPILDSAVSSSTDTSITGTFGSGLVNGQPFEPNEAITLDFYANPSPDPSGYGQGQTYLGETTVTTDANGNVAFTTDLAVGNLAGQWITATATDPNGDTSEFSAAVPILAPNETFAQFLQTALPQSSSQSNLLTIVANPSTMPATVIEAVNALTNITQPVTIVLDLGGGTYSTGGVAADPPPNVTFVVQNGTLDPSYPALTVAGGQVSVLHCTLTSSGNVPTLLVTGGNVTLLHDNIVQASTVYTDPAVSVTGGKVNLGTAGTPGNNTLSVNSSGDLVSNTSGNPISAVGDTFTVGGNVKTAPSLSFTGLATSAASIIPGQPVTFTATVAPDMLGSATPTGDVDFYDTTTNTDLGTVSLSSGVASLNTSALAPGTHVIRASYSGDSSYLPSAAMLTQTVTTSIFVLDPTAGGALSLSGNAGISIPGALVVDSNSKTAMAESGSASVKAGSIQVVGGVSRSGNATLSPAATTGAKVVLDPLAGLVAPIASNLGLSNQGAVTLSGNASKTICPGIYSQISVSGNASLTFKPGIYILAGGGLTLSGNANISGNGVVIFNAGSAYNANSGSDGGTYGSITLSGNGTYALCAPASGPYAGILIFQDRSNPRGLTLSGDSTIGSSGTIYAPKAALTMSGNAEGGTGQQQMLSFVVDTIALSSNSTANGLGAPPAGTVAYAPAQISAAYGINHLSMDGTGQTIAIVDAYDDPSIFQSLDTFDNQFGLTASGPTLYAQYGPASSFLTVLNQYGQPTSLPSTDPSGAGTDNWEVEAALDVEWAHAIAPGAQIVLVEANSQLLSDLMAAVGTAAHQPGVSVVSISWGFPEGQAILAADEAAYDNVFSVPGVTFVASTGDYGTADPEYPAFSPNVVAVGGTSLTLNADSSYNCETGWGYYSSSAGASIGSGGGISLYETEPAYQQGVQSLGMRTTPDVALVADPATGAWIADTFNLDPSNPFEVVGGTSLSAPAWAGLLTLVNQGRAAAGESALSTTSPTEVQQALYTLPNSDYNVITSGSNGYIANSGYNLVTGLGTPVANRLVADLVAYQGPGTVYNGPTVGPLQDASLNGNWAGGGGPDDVFSVFDSLTVTNAGVNDGIAGRVSRQQIAAGHVATIAGSVDRPTTGLQGEPRVEVWCTEAARPAQPLAQPETPANFAVAQVLGLVLDADSRETLIGDLAFEQVSSGVPKAPSRAADF